jgi:hypothetical protein
MNGASLCVRHVAASLTLLSFAGARIKNYANQRNGDYTSGWINPAATTLIVACLPSTSRPAGPTARWRVIRSYFNRTFVFRWLNQGIESTARVRAMTPRVILVR